VDHALEFKPLDFIVKEIKGVAALHSKTLQYQIINGIFKQGRAAVVGSTADSQERFAGYMPKETDLPSDFLRRFAGSIDFHSNFNHMLNKGRKVSLGQLLKSNRRRDTFVGYCGLLMAGLETEASLASFLPKLHQIIITQRDLVLDRATKERIKSHPGSTVMTPTVEEVASQPEEDVVLEEVEEMETFNEVSGIEITTLLDEILNLYYSLPVSNGEDLEIEEEQEDYYDQHIVVAKRETFIFKEELGCTGVRVIVDPVHETVTSITFDFQDDLSVVTYKTITEALASILHLLNHNADLRLLSHLEKENRNTNYESVQSMATKFGRLLDR